MPAPAEFDPERAAPLRTFLLAFLLLATVFLAHLPVLDGWWTTDDPQVLLHAQRNSPIDILFDPAVWRVLSTSSFTPLVTLSFGFDLALFGLEPLFFYEHQILAIALVALLAFLLLERSCGKIVAILVAAAAAVSPAMALAANSLMVRHYLEGLAFALAALLVLRLAPAERKSFGPDLAIAALYLFAMLAKEIYAPLPLLFVAELRIRQVPWRSLIVRMIPTAVAAALYLVWRSAMLGSGGGYGTGIDLREILLLGPRIGAMVLAPATPLVIWALAAAVLLVGVVAVIRVPRAAGWWGAATGVALLLPLIPVAGEPQARYAIVPMTAAILLAGAGVATLPRRYSIAVAALLLAASLAGGQLAHRDLERSFRAMIAEGRYVWVGPPSAPPLLAGSPGWYLEGLRDLRELSEGGEAPQYVLSAYALAAGAVEPEEVVTSEGGSSELRRLEPGRILAIARERQLRDDSIPLQLRVVLRESVVSWELDPTPADFIWLTWPEFDEYPVEPSGSRRIPLSVGTDRFLIRREEPDGRWTLSPPLALPPADGVVEWDRGAQNPEVQNTGGVSLGPPA
ncbi:MAG: hypothetical protein LC732_00490 [Acidobacteria bacterium]|nr:hypothetical protein [Acidobacteriota bacterium]